MKPLQYLYDCHSSVKQLTDENGNITDTYTYDAWGNLTASTGDTANTYLYCCEQFNSTTGLYYLRARYMNPSTGTFTSMDTYQGSTFDPITLHKYLYANANPVMNCDPSGYSATLAGMSATMEARESLDEAYAVHNAWAIRMGKKILISLRIGTYIGVSISLLFGEELLDLCSDVLNGGTEFGHRVRDEIIENVVPKVISIPDTVSKADAKIRRTIKNHPVHKYWEIEICKILTNGKLLCFPVIGRGITQASAIQRLMMGGSTITIHQYDARKISSIAGSMEPMHHPFRDNPTIGQFGHYHVGKHFNSAHSMYIMGE